MDCKKVFVGLILFICTSCANEKGRSSFESWFINDTYPIKIDLEKGYQFSHLQINYQNIILNLDEGNLVLIECDEGVTGALINSRGFISHFNSTQVANNYYPVEGYLLFRFHSDDYAAIFARQVLHEWNAEDKTDELWGIIKQRFNFAFAKDLDVVLPPKGSYGLTCDRVSIVFDAEKSNNIVWSSNYRIITP